MRIKRLRRSCPGVRHKRTVLKIRCLLDMELASAQVCPGSGASVTAGKESGFRRLSFVSGCVRTVTHWDIPAGEDFCRPAPEIAPVSGSYRRVWRRLKGRTPGRTVGTWAPQKRVRWAQAAAGPVPTPEGSASAAHASTYQPQVCRTLVDSRCSSDARLQTTTG